MFVLIGTFIEEVFSPIPSFVVLVPSGAAAHAQGAGVWYLGVLMVISAFGRIAGGSILYWLANRFEGVLLGKGRRILGVSHKQVEQFRVRLDKAGRHEWTLLLLANAIPILPTAALSLCCGFVKVRFKVFLVSTFFGTMVNSLIYLLIGYGGLAVAESLKGIELATQITLGLLIAAGVIWWVWHRHRNHAKRKAVSL